MATHDTETTAAGERPRRDPAQPLSVTAPLHQPFLGQDGEPCAVCDAPLASDQRYCLRCGSRRAEARLPFMDILSEPRVRRERELELAAPAAAAPPEWYRSAVAGLAALAAVALLGIGIAAGALLDPDPKAPRAVAQKPPIVNITNTGGGGAAAAPAAFVSDWPEGEEGWTVQLQALPKDGTQPDAVTAAKTAATGLGATNVGALDSDAYPSLDPGAYVVYSGVFSTRKEAAAAAKKLRRSFPDAAAVKVAATAGGASSAPVDKEPAKTQSKEELKKKESLTPEQYQQEQKKKQPDKLKSEGAAPTPDSKAPGGGTGATEIG